MASGSGGPGGDGEAKLKWMYDGPKSDINREDYLLGKKIDKNFEIVSDVVIRDTGEERQKELFAGRATGINKPTHSSSNFKESVLQTDIVRKEDPLVLLKLREEQKKRAVLENPLTQMRIKRVLKEAFEKEMGKKRRKRREGPTNDGDSSSSDSDTSSEHKSRRKHVGEHSQHSGRSSRMRSEHSHHHAHRHRRQRYGSRDSRPSREERQHRRHHRHELSESPRRRDRDGAERSDRHDRDTGRASASSSSQRHERSGHSRHEGRAEDSGRKRLTADEMKARLEAMTVNAKWRDDYREENLHRATEELKREVEESQQHQKSAVGANLLRPMFNAAAESSSVEKRIQSNRMRVQRSHDYMEKAFARK